MQVPLDVKLKAMLWDFPEKSRIQLTGKILSSPFEAFRDDEQLFLRAMNSLRWYELYTLLGPQNLVLLLTDTTIRKLFPVQKRNYYINARRLLSKYCLPVSGQTA